MILRRAMVDILPTKIQWRRGKGNLGIAFDHTLQKFGKGLMAEVINHSSDSLSTFIDMADLGKIYERFNQGQASTEDILSLWQAVNLSLWLETRQSSTTGISPKVN
ncbi:MAG: hypothetical protein HC934_08445 [Acaryochloridaceae cyanobacterium SU_2_1]|nr:hypothetical protein [Acaryochloridaceae cyanobacterium SU_2_1]